MEACPAKSDYAFQINELRTAVNSPSLTPEPARLADQLGLLRAGFFSSGIAKEFESLPD